MYQEMHSGTEFNHMDFLGSNSRQTERNSPFTFLCRTRLTTRSLLHFLAFGPHKYYKGPIHVDQGRFAMPDFHQRLLLTRMDDQATTQPLLSSYNILYPCMLDCGTNSTGTLTCRFT